MLSRSRLRPLDVVLTITGFPGTACVVTEKDLPLNMNQHCVRFHLRDNWNPYFVASFINSIWGKAQIERRAIGGTREALDYPSILSLKIPSVPKENQDFVAGHVQFYNESLDLANQLIYEAKQNVESLIQDTLDIDTLIDESVQIERWLKENPSPYAGSAISDV